MMPEHDARPAILVVDDEADGLRSLEFRLAGEARVKVRHPSDLEYEDLAEADLILMDYWLRQWPERDIQPVAFDVQTGMALATVLREIADKTAPERLTVVALHTGHLTEASGRIRPPYSKHVVARLNNLEWIFEKSKKGNEEDPYPQVVQLARAAQRLQGDWPTDSSASEARARELLNLDDSVEWFERSWREVRECQPPLYELGSVFRGALFLRWLLHQILPYPCFLWDANWVAARLRMQASDLDRLVASDCDLARDLKQLEYTGVLAGFLGARWWRTALDDYAWALGGGTSGKREEFGDRLREKAGEDLELAVPSDAVVCLDRDFHAACVASPKDAVRLRPDYWPAFADAAWMRIADVRGDRELTAMVEPLDQYRVTPDG